MDAEDLAYFDAHEPEGMTRKHLHHILQKLARNKALAKEILEVQKKLRKLGLDPIIGPEMLVYAPNIQGQHGYDAMRPVIDALSDALALPDANKESITEVLQRLAKEAAERKPGE